MSQLVPIGKVAEVNPTIPKTLSSPSDKIVTFLPMAAVSEEGRIIAREESPISAVIKGYRYFQQGDVLLAKITPCMENGKAVFVEDVPHKIGFGSTEFHVLRPSSEIDGQYLFYMIWNPTFRYIAERNMTGTAGQRRVPTDFVKSYKIPLPPLKEQRRIAAILDKADAVRRKRQQAIALTEELLRSAFLEMFGDPVTNPKGWTLNKLSSVCSKITDGTHHSPPTLNEGIPYITAKHLKVNGLDFFSNPWFISEEDHKKIYARCNPEKGDVLYIKDGATSGIAALNTYDFEFSMLSSLALLKAGENVTSEYLCDWLNNEGVKKNHLKNVAGAAITRLTLTKIKDFYIPVPPISRQIQYKGIRQNIFKLISNFRNQETESLNLFNSLLQRAFQGKM